MSDSVGRPSGRLHGVDALRGVAAASVAWFHLTNGYAAGVVQQSGSLGWLGVDAFFVISGFVIPLTMERSGYRTIELGRFMARRMIRLEPPYIASIVLVVILNMASAWAPGFAGAPQHYALKQLASHLLYLAPLAGTSWIQPVYWSLAYEFAFYIACGLLFPLLWRRSLSLLVLATAGAVLIKFCLTGALDGRIPLFLIGASAARRHLGRDGVVAFLSALAVSAAAMVLMGSTLNACVGVASALAIVLIRMPPWRPLIWLGGISYSLYLIHVPIGGRIVNLGKRFGGGSVYELLLSALAIAACIAFAWLFNRLVEAPAVRWSHKLGSNVGAPVIESSAER